MEREKLVQERESKRKNNHYQERKKEQEIGEEGD